MILGGWGDIEIKFAAQLFLLSLLYASKLASISAKEKAHAIA